MIKDFMIKIIDHKLIDDSYNNYIVLEFSGNQINHVIMNTLRRVILELIPIYAFNKDDIIITKNTSIYNNDYMRLRISNFPIINIKNDISTIKKSIDLEYQVNITSFDQRIDNIEKQKELEFLENTEKAQNFIMNINVKNTTNNILNVTTDTDGISYYYKGNNIPSPYKSKLLILKLKPNEEFICTATSTLNISLKNIIYSPVAICVYTEINNNTYHLNIESLKQLNEKEIVIRACNIINIKLDNFLNIILKKLSDYKNEIYVDEYNLDNSTTEAYKETINEYYIKGMIVIENESHTFGNLLTRFLQDHPNILFAGYKIDHLLIKELTILYKTNGTSIVDIIKDIINNAKILFNNIIKLI